MLRAHRQAWCWQDEYFGLTMADIRRLELETQKALKDKMAAVQEGGVTKIDGEESSGDHRPKASDSISTLTGNRINCVCRSYK